MASKPPAIFPTLLVVNKYFSNMDLEKEKKIPTIYIAKQKQANICDDKL
jgi:hypothetical protein